MNSPDKLASSGNNNVEVAENLVTIHIDKKMYKSPNPTTGVALYKLGAIDFNKYDLWLEVHSHGDDIPILYDETQIELKNGSHFYSAQKSLNPGS